MRLLKFNTIFVAFLVFIGSASPAIADPDDRIGIKLGKGTLQEVLDLVATQQKINLIIDDGVPLEKKVDINIDSLSVAQTMEVVLAANNLGSRKMGEGTFVIFPLNKASIYRGQAEIRKFSLIDTLVDTAQLKQLLTSQFPGIQVYIDNKNLNTILVMGSPETLDLVGELMAKISGSLDKIEKLFVPLRNVDPTAATTMLKNMDPDTSILESPGKNGLIIIGTKAKEIEKILLEIDRAPPQEIKVFEVTFQDLGKLSPLIKGLDEKAKILALPDHNKMVVQANGQTMALIEKAVEAMDQPKKQVLFDLRLIEVNLEALKKLGLQLTQSGFTVSEIKGLVDSKIYPFLLNLVKDDKNARILANPKLKVMEGHTGRITIGDRIPLEVAATSQTESGSVLKFNTQLQWVDAGIKFVVDKVQVHRGNRTSLELKTEVSSVVGTNPKGHPLLRTREAETSLLLGDGETAILAGLINREERVTISKVPFLSKLPILGRIFQTRDKRRVDSEILLFVTAHIQHGVTDAPVPEETSKNYFRPIPPVARKKYRLLKYRGALEDLREKVKSYDDPEGNAENSERENP